MRLRPAPARTWRRSSNVCAAGSSRCCATRAGGCTTSTSAPTALRRGYAATARSSRFFFARGSRTAGCPSAGRRPRLPDDVLLPFGAGHFALFHALARHVIGSEPAALVVVVLVHFVRFAHVSLVRVTEGTEETDSHGGTG